MQDLWKRATEYPRGDANRTAPTWAANRPPSWRAPGTTRARPNTHVGARTAYPTHMRPLQEITNARPVRTEYPRGRANRVPTCPREPNNSHWPRTAHPVGADRAPLGRDRLPTWGREPHTPRICAGSKDHERTSRTNRIPTWARTEYPRRRATGKPHGRANRIGTQSVFLPCDSVSRIDPSGRGQN